MDVTAGSLRQRALNLSKGIVMGRMETAKRFEEAADTIERLTKELEGAAEGHRVLEGEIRHRGERFDLLAKERDALKAEVERLKAENDRLDIGAGMKLLQEVEEHDKDERRR